MITKRAIAGVAAAAAIAAGLSACAASAKDFGGPEGLIAAASPSATSCGSGSAATP